ncbi:MAG: DUF4266 domain-containing protein [Nitrospiria bacterium]
MSRKSKFFIFLTLFLFSGCVAVQPWEREYLADPIMTQEGEIGETVFDTHLFRARSGGVLGSSGEGAGCGCEQ